MKATEPIKTNKPTETPPKPPKAAGVKLSLGINEPRWKQYQQEGYSDTQIEAMLKADIEKAISRGSYDTINKLIDGMVITIEIGDYY